jgi:long-subunit fatty acid transport protein
MSSVCIRHIQKVSRKGAKVAKKQRLIFYKKRFSFALSAPLREIKPPLREIITVDFSQHSDYHPMMMIKDNISIGKNLVLSAALLIIIQMCPVVPAFGVAEFEIPSSFNPVGSGARAIGMGGAFIAAADDATAASWNPGGLIRLTLPEFSIVTAGFHRKEDIDFQSNPEAAGSHSVSEKNINYLSITYPFGFFNRNMVVSLSYQHLYDLNRDWQFTFQNSMTGLEDQWDVAQSGGLSAVGLSYCIQVIPELSAGFTLNFWDDDLGKNRWEQNFRADSGFAGMPMIHFDRKEKFSFSGINANIGLLWRINYKLSLGAVLKTPFSADVRREIEENQIYISEPENITFSEQDTRNETVEMPMSYGIGLVYRCSDQLFMSADIYRTEWGDFIYREENGNEKSPVSARPLSESDVKPTHQIRAGAEYRFMNPNKGYIIPVRCGIFYDPAPAEGNPDDFYGFSIGSGFTLNDRFSLDIAYQYRFGNDVGDHILEPLGFSQDVKEHTLYFSVIFYP